MTGSASHVGQRAARRGVCTDWWWSVAGCCGRSSLVPVTDRSPSGHGRRVLIDVSDAYRFCVCVCVWGGGGRERESVCVCTPLKKAGPFVVH